MRSRQLAVTTLVAATLGASMASGAAGASPTGIAVTHSGVAHAAHFVTDGVNRLQTCYAQLDDDNGLGVVSQNFETAYNDYDSRGADDFYLQSACQVRRVDVVGEYFSGPGPADSANVTLYRDFNGAPGGVITNQENLTAVGDGTGSFRITLTTGVGLAPGRYFVSVQINMDLDPAGEWSWRTNDTARGIRALWRNKSDGFGTGCVHYTRLTRCIHGGEGRDFAFAIVGS